MKLSANWIREWVDSTASSHEIAATLTDAGLEVDGVEVAVADIEGVLVGEVLSLEKHPDADRLNVCQVNLGTTQVQIVCGAANARVGLKAPVATLGTKLPNGLKIKKAKLRGVASEGMLCSASELGLEDQSDGLMELVAEATVGTPLIDYLGGADDAIDIDLTPNRGDCFSVIGIARDYAAKAGVAFTPPVIEPVAATTDRVQAVRIEEPEGCAVFAGRIISGLDTNAQSPLWLQERLRRCGLRPISPLVDVTNLVMMELGQPMHAYDADKINGEVCVRLGDGKEEITLIDGKNVTVLDNTLAVCDKNGALGLGGVMGGASSAIGNSTENVYLEAAWWHPDWIMGRMRQYGLATDAGQRFERGVDRQGQVRAIERATQLILDICGGEAGPVCVEGSAPIAPTEIPLREERIERLLGAPVSIKDASQILTRLQIDNVVGGAQLLAQCPNWRFDIDAEWDLIEEVARIMGYDAFPTRAPVPIATHEIGGETDVSVNRIVDRMVDLGYREVISYSFVNAEKHALIYGDDSGIALMNPISTDLSLMRDGLVPSLIQIAEHNIHRQHRNIRIFETGRRYFKAADGTHQEEVLLSGLISGQRQSVSWHSRSEAVDFYDIKGDVEQLLAGHGGLEFDVVDVEWLHPGRSAGVRLNGKRIGVLGQIHPRVAKAFAVRQDMYVFELSMPSLLLQQRPKFSAFSTFPAIKRDLAFVVDTAVSARQLINVVKKNGGENLVDVRVFDVFRQKSEISEQYSVAIALTFQSNFSTLQDTEIDTIITQIITTLGTQHGAELRS